MRVAQRRRDVPAKKTATLEKFGKADHKISNSREKSEFPTDITLKLGDKIIKNPV